MSSSTGSSATYMTVLTGLYEAELLDAYEQAPGADALRQLTGALEMGAAVWGAPELLAAMSIAVEPAPATSGATTATTTTTATQAAVGENGRPNRAEAVAAAEASASPRKRDRNGGNDARQR